jgi:hypothetical protein
MNLSFHKNIISIVVTMFAGLRFNIAVTPDLGHGAAITFSTGFLALLLSIDWTGISREAIETTVLGTTGGKTYMPGDNYDPGELSVEMQFASDAAPPITAIAETVTLTFDDAETWAAEAFMTGYEITNITNEGVMTANATLKFSGSITF